MVKFGKKFFFNEDDDSSKKTSPKKSPSKKSKKSKKSDFSLKEKISFFLNKLSYILKKILPFIIIAIVILLIIIGLKACNNKSKNKKKPNNDTIIKAVEPKFYDEIKISLGDEIPTKDKLIKNYEKFSDEEIKINVDNAKVVNNKFTEVGEYEINVKVNEYEKNIKVVVKDTTPPTLKLKDVTIQEGKTYKISDFIESCSDDSKETCIYEYVDNNQSNIKAVGTYDIKIVAFDKYENKSKEETAKLTINAKATPTPTPTPTPSPTPTPTPTPTPSPTPTPTPTPTPKPVENKCQYGNDSYNTKSYVLAYVVSKNGCAIDPTIAKTDKYIESPRKISKTDYNKLIKDLEKLDLDMEISYRSFINPIFNTTNEGFVGYQINITLTGNNTTLVEYSLKPDGSRVFKTNKIGL